MYFGLGAYGAAWTLLYMAPSLLLFPAGQAWRLAPRGGRSSGYLSIRTRGVYFILLTLIFAEFGYQAIFNGGNDHGRAERPVEPAESGGIDIWLIEHLDWNDAASAYYLAVGGFRRPPTTVARWIVVSPFGATLAAVRDNDDRATYLGYNVAAIKRRVFTISACLPDLQGHSGRITSPTSHLN